MAYDLLIKNGTVVDGTGAPRRQADVAIANGRIAEIGKVRRAPPKSSTRPISSWRPDSSITIPITTPRSVGTR